MSHTLDRCWSNPCNPEARVDYCIRRLNDYRRARIPIPPWMREFSIKHPPGNGREDVFEEELPPPPPVT